VARGIAIAAVGFLVAAGVDAAQVTPIAFVGRFVDIKEVGCDSGDTVDEITGEPVIVICMDSVYEVRYQIEKVLEGNLMAGAEVKFQAADHYGFPAFAEQRRALIYLQQYKDGYWHVKYQWNEAYATNDGDFARCGCGARDYYDTDDDDTVLAKDCRSISFSPPVTRDLTHVSKYVIDSLRASLDYQVRGDRAYCVRGVLVEDLYRQERPDLIESLNAKD
jgi:hypothetical protein